MSDQQDEQLLKQAKKPRLNLTTSQVAASALAACSASIVASYLGVAGTVIGAAVGSVVATTGAAIWSHLFRTGGDKIKQTLLVNGQPVEVEVDRGEMAEAAVPAGRFYGAQAADANTATEIVGLWHPKTATGETRVITDETRTELNGLRAGSSPSASGPQVVRMKKYRKPIGIAAAIVAVFCVSIVVGVFAGAPVRSAGSSSSTVTTTTTVTKTEQTHGQSGSGSSSSSSSAASPSTGSTSSGSASPSGSATPSSSASSAASPGASSSAGSGATSTGQAQVGATSTGSPAN